jgi:hypothetical protein
MRRLARSSWPVLAAAAVAIGGCAAAQCTTPWLPGSPLAGTNGTVFALTAWDPDGAGPQPPLVVVAGNFLHAGGVWVDHLSRWNGTTWTMLGPVTTGVQALAAMPNGSLTALTATNRLTLTIGSF